MLKSAYTFLVKRFDKFLQKNNSKGMVRIDKTSSKLNALNIKDQKILDVINNLRRVKSWEYDSKRCRTTVFSLICYLQRIASGRCDSI